MGVLLFIEVRIASGRHLKDRLRRAVFHTRSERKPLRDRDAITADMAAFNNCEG
jgi:hypothetical protein